MPSEIHCDVLPSSGLPDLRFCLVHGPRKGGTTMLQGLLDSQDHVLMRPGELKLKRLYVPKMLEFVSPAEIFAAISDLYNGGDNYHGELGDAYRDVLGEAMARGASLHELVTLEVLELRRCLAPELPPAECEVVAFKEVGGRLNQVLQAALLLFPRLKAVLITRSPMEVSSAIYRSRRRRGQAMGLRSLMQQAVEPWQVLLSQMPLLGAPRICILSYESLVQDPPRAAARLEAFLELPPSSLRFEATTLFGRPTTTRTASIDSSRVFVSRVPWYRGLSPLEVMLVLFAAAYFRLRLLFLCLLGERRWATYRGFVRALEA